MNFNSVVRPYLGTWVGLAIPYNKQVTPLWNEWAKVAIPLRAFDYSSKTWLMPASSVPLALHEALQLGLISPGTFNASMAQNERLLRTRGQDFGIYDGLTPRPRNAYSDAQLVLALGPNAPPKLVDLVYRWWKNEFKSTPGVVAQEEELDAAYVTLGGKL